MSYLIVSVKEHTSDNGTTTTVVVVTEEKTADEMAAAAAELNKFAVAAASFAESLPYHVPFDLFRQYHPFRPPPIPRTFVVPSEKLPHRTVAHKLRRWLARAPPDSSGSRGFSGPPVALLRAGQVL